MPTIVFQAVVLDSSTLGDPVIRIVQEDGEFVIMRGNRYLTRVNPASSNTLYSWQRWADKPWLISCKTAEEAIAIVSTTLETNLSFDTVRLNGSDY